MTTSRNYSDLKYGIDSNAERNCWVAYHLFALLSSLIGDTLILIASFQRNTFKINKFIVSVIQHIAVCDLATAISTVLPITVSLQTISWILGDKMCFVVNYMFNFAYAV
jgi:hypothetical protein